jgi:hypothetical protein
MWFIHYAYTDDSGFTLTRSKKEFDVAKDGV